MNTGRAFAAAAVTLALVAGTAQADSRKPRDNSFEVGAFLGLFFPSDDHEFYDPEVATQEELETLGFGGGLRLGYYPLAFLGIEGEGEYTHVGSEVDGSLDLFGLRAHLIAQLPYRVTPFAVAGVGTTWARSGDDVQGDDQERLWHLGLGAKIWATEQVLVRLDGRAYLGPHVRDGLDDNGMTTHFAVTAGVSFRFGGGDEAADPDPDGDGVLGAADECPTVAGEAPTGCPPGDADQDGILDSEDACPNEPETVNGVDDEDGCPDEVGDSDGDGIDDQTDECPNEAEDGDGFQDEDGCPDPDNDGDGLLDTADNCPDEAGPAENKGCPDTDRDSDGVVDRLDNCPDEAGTKENQGCKDKQLVVLQETKIEILDKVYFRSGRARIRPRSHRLLDNVADVLNAHPEILKVRIEGHTDDRGKDDFNMKLSQERANAVRDYLVGKGVAAERLEAVGLGETQAIDTNETKAGRAANRRVEFEIEEMAPPKAVPAPAEKAAPAEGGDAGE